MFDSGLLPSFVAIAETGSFTRAAVRLGVTQSSVSQQLRRLEAQLGRVLVARSTHSVGLTPDGAVMLRHAREILDAVAAAGLAMERAALDGVVRLGMAEDFATTRLSQILRRFRRAHREVRLRVEIGLSGTLLDRLDGGEFDLVLAKRRIGARRKAGDDEASWVAPRAISLCDEPLVWVGAPGELALAGRRPLPLALHPAPSVTAAAMREALADAGIEAECAHVSAGISGLRAGILAGLGISAFGRSFVPAGLEILDGAAHGLPTLPKLRFMLARGRVTSEAADALAAVILEEAAGLAPRFVASRAPELVSEPLGAA